MWVFSGFFGFQQTKVYRRRPFSICQATLLKPCVYHQLNCSIVDLSCFSVMLNFADLTSSSRFVILLFRKLTSRRVIRCTGSPVFQAERKADNLRPANLIRIMPVEESQIIGSCLAYLGCLCIQEKIPPLALNAFERRVFCVLSSLPMAS